MIDVNSITEEDMDILNDLMGIKNTRSKFIDDILRVCDRGHLYASLTCNYEDLPLYLNDKDKLQMIWTNWRLKIGK